MAQYTPPFYVATVSDVAGTVAANSFISIFNPANSTRAVVLYLGEIKNYAVGATQVGSSLNARRITASTGGTLTAAADVTRFLTTTVDPLAEIRTGNPTVTLTGNILNSWPPPISTGAGTGSITGTATPPTAGFICLPGQGVVFRTTSGDINQRWTVTLIWAEVEL